MISSSTRRAGPYVADFANASYPFGFKVLEPADVAVVVTDGLDEYGSPQERKLTYGTEYTVALNVNQDVAPGGQVFLVANMVGRSFVLRSDTPIEQPAVYTNTGNFYPRVLNDSLDRATINIQELDERLDRALLMPEVDPPVGFFPVILPGGKWGFLPLDGFSWTPENPPPPTEELDMISVATRAAMAALTDVPVGGVVWLNEPLRYGFFVKRAGAQPAADALQGLYVAATSGAFYYERVWDGVEGKPEWFGADPAITTGTGPANNLAAIKGCFVLCPTTILRPLEYYINDTLVLDVDSHRLAGPVMGIEGTAPQGARLVQTNLTKDVVRIGGTSTANRKKCIFVENITARWSADLVPPAPGSSDAVRLQSPMGFRMEHAIVCQTIRCVALDAMIGHGFFSTVNSRCVQGGCTRTKGFGAGDFMVGYWLYGTAAQSGFAGANASIFFDDINCTALDSTLQTSLDKATGLYATADWADLYVNGFETSQVNFGIRLDGAGWTYAGGHGDVHLRKLVFDQCKGSGLVIHNTNNFAKIHVDGFYIQVISTGLVSNAGIELVDGGGYITIANGHVTGHPGNQSYGIVLRNKLAVTVSDTVVIESIGYPFDGKGNGQGCRLSPSVGDGAGGTPGTKAAFSLEGFSQFYAAPNIRGVAGYWSEGINLIGTLNLSGYINPSLVDGVAIANGRKVVVNGAKISAPGYYTATGGSGSNGAGLNVDGVTA